MPALLLLSFNFRLDLIQIILIFFSKFSAYPALELSNLAASLNNMALIHTDKGNLHSAQKLHEEALQIRRHALEPDSLDLAASLYNLADVHHKQKRLDTAIELYEEALRIETKVLPGNSPLLSASLNGIGHAYFDAGELDIIIIEIQ